MRIALAQINPCKQLPSLCTYEGMQRRLSETYAAVHEALHEAAHEALTDVRSSQVPR